MQVLVTSSTTSGCGSTSYAVVGNKLRSSINSHMEMGQVTVSCHRTLVRSMSEPGPVDQVAILYLQV